MNRNAALRREFLRHAQSWLPPLKVRPPPRSVLPHLCYLPTSNQLIRNSLGVSEEGFITHLEPLSHPSSQSLLAPSSTLSSSFPNTSSSDSPASVTRLGLHSFFLPVFTDLHLHAPQYLYAGTGLDLPLMEWLDRYAYAAEERIDSDEDLAGRVYDRLVERLGKVGTGCVVLFGTVGVAAKWVCHGIMSRWSELIMGDCCSLILARACLEGGIRAFVGKLSMDMSPVRSRTRTRRLL